MKARKGDKGGDEHERLPANRHLYVAKGNGQYNMTFPLAEFDSDGSHTE